MPRVCRRALPLPALLPPNHHLPFPARVLARLKGGESTLSAILDGFTEDEWREAARTLDRLVEAGRVTCRVEQYGWRATIAIYKARVIQVFSFMEANADARLTQAS